MNIHGRYGLEIGALDHPIIPPNNPGIHFADHLSTAELREKYRGDPNVNVDELVEVDFVWTQHSRLSTLVDNKRFAFAIASHVIEHIPDMISWLEQLREILEPDGRVGLIIPDKRFTFDCHRHTTTVPEVLEAWLRKLTRPSVRQIMDHFYHMAAVPASTSVQELWSNQNVSATAPRVHPTLLQELGAAGLQTYDARVAAGEYIDTHCSTFTPESFRLVIQELRQIGLCDFFVEHFSPTRVNENEFWAVLRPV
jgi:predicted SAM-dependent methyltransferase